MAVNHLVAQMWLGGDPQRRESEIWLEADSLRKMTMFRCFTPLAPMRPKKGVETPKWISPLNGDNTKIFPKNATDSDQKRIWRDDSTPKILLDPSYGAGPVEV